MPDSTLELIFLWQMDIYGDCDDNFYGAKGGLQEYNPQAAYTK